MKKIKKELWTRHAYDRVTERTDMNSTELIYISRYAIKNGLNFNDLPDGPLKNYVYAKSKIKGKRIKLYRGYVFIFFRASKRMITCYPIPEKHVEEYNAAVADLKRRQKENRERKELEKNGQQG